MRSSFLLLLLANLLVACGHTENAKEKSNPAKIDSVTATTQTSKSCLSVVKPEKLGKSDEYQESAKPIKVSVTVDQDTSSMQVADECYFNNTVTILATKKTGSRVFKRTLLKDDLLYFTKSDKSIEQAILQSVTYKPTFNSQKYVTVNMRLIEPGTKKTLDYLVTMNYFGEIIKVK
ncbi:hypothetical protein [Spirosoma pollinicola]|uniref:DUF4738 domain-containing protein n=1 Tax=Spirosoma pollinicola TaxID=2057025 RepID=A0A2K8YW19_9BACT|nr:hypothetical protein [Spirosoma pollinicola]AUD01793.1 hypothetical protein CWM47_08145 [Spirosoma pollinicola]